MATWHPTLFLPLLLVGGCFQQDKAGTSQILTSDPQTSYYQVRSCRLSSGHGSNYMVVLANALAESDYLSGGGPLPQGSVIVAVESDQADCSDLTGYTLMSKDVPGYNPTAGDWHWQRLDDQRDVLQDGRVQGCISCHTQCNRNDFTCSPP
jgi:hypothetical protein